MTNELTLSKNLELIKDSEFKRAAEATEPVNYREILKLQYEALDKFLAQNPLARESYNSSPSQQRVVGYCKIYDAVKRGLRSRQDKTVREVYVEDSNLREDIASLNATGLARIYVNSEDFTSSSLDREALERRLDPFALGLISSAVSSEIVKM